MRYLATTLAFLAACGTANIAPNKRGDATPQGTVDPGGNGEIAGDVGTAGPQTTGDAGRIIAEADIIQVQGDVLFALSPNGRLSLVDIAQPARLAILGQTNILGRPFEMYARNGYVLVLSDAVDGDAALIAVDVKDVTKPTVIGTHETQGAIADSRIMGDVLYLVTYASAIALTTNVTSFDVLDATKIHSVQTLSLAGDENSRYEGRSVVITDKRLYVGGLSANDNTFDEGIVDVIDVSDPAGTLKQGARLRITGTMMSRWQLDETNGVLRVVSQRGATAATENGFGEPVVQTFAIQEGDPATFTALGRTAITLPRQEGLKSARFDGDRLYVITFEQTDPLFLIDLSNPAEPKQRGELQLPGYLFHLEPKGDRLLGLGVDAEDEFGSLNVSLVNVADMDAPTLIKRVAFAPARTNGVWLLPEDQDRIQKAFRRFASGLVVVPFAGSTLCSNDGGGVQTITWADDTLLKRALLPLGGRPRRALEHKTELLAISESQVRTFSLASLDVTTHTAEIAIDTCYDPPPPISSAGSQSQTPPVKAGPDLGASSGQSNDYGIKWQTSKPKQTQTQQKDATGTIKGGCSQSGNADLFAFGAIAYLMLTRRRTSTTRRSR